MNTHSKSRGKTHEEVEAELKELLKRTLSELPDDGDARDYKRNMAQAMKGEEGCIHS